MIKFWGIGGQKRINQKYVCFPFVTIVLAFAGNVFSSFARVVFLILLVVVVVVVVVVSRGFGILDKTRA